MEFGPILRAMNRNKVRFGLIVLEIALTLAIVTNCVNMIREAKHEIARPSGFDDENIIWVRSLPFAPEFKEDGVLDNGVRQDLVTLRSIPGVKAASNTRFLPWGGGGSSMETRVLGSKGDMLRNQVYNADDGTLGTLGAQLVGGRNFTADETESEVVRLRQLLNNPRALGADGTPKEKITQDVIMSKAFAELAFKDGKALGRRLEDSDGDQYQVVGVIDKFYNPYGWPIHEYAMFFPGRSRSFEGGASYLVRTEPGRVKAVLGELEKRLVAANPGRNVRVKTLLEVKDLYFTGQNLTVKLLTVVIFLLLFVTSLGIVGVTAFSVAERTRQIGTRRALGAQKRDILQYFLLENWIVTSLGLAIGVVLTYGLNVALVSQISATKIDMSLVLVGVGLLWGAGLLATLFPALRGVRVAPAVATRNV